MAGRDLTQGDVVQALSAASQQHNIQLMKDAAVRLEAMAKLHDFHAFIYNTFLDNSLPFEIRYLAIITFKNGVDRFWRKTASHAIRASEKQYIKERLLLPISEPNRKLGVLNNVAIGKIARYDFPQEWPTLIDDLTRIIRDGGAVQLDRGLHTIAQIIKSLCATRFGKVRQTLQSVAPMIFGFVGSIYEKSMNDWLQSRSDGPIGSPQDYTYVCFSCLKIIRMILLYGYENLNRESQAQEMFTLISQHFENVYGLWSTNPDEASQKFLKLYMKLVLGLVDAQPTAFALMPNVINLVKNFWTIVERVAESVQLVGEDEQKKSFEERFVVHGMLVLRACLKLTFHPAQSIRLRTEAEKVETQKSTDRFKTELFDHEFVVRVAECLVTRYLVLRQGDLMRWENDPENWLNEENSASYEYQVRPCAEKLLVDLVLDFKEILVHPLLEVFLNAPRGSDMQSVLIRDAIYCAIGLNASSLYDEFDFDAWLTQGLSNDVLSQDSRSKILQRRAAITIGQWVLVKCKKENRHIIYSILQHLLDPSKGGSDRVVRLTAVSNLGICINEWEFESESFAPFQDYCFSRLLDIVDEVVELDTKLTVGRCIGDMIERIDSQVVTHASEILRRMPVLWQESGDEDMLKSAILVTLTKLVHAVKEKSNGTYHVTLPMIRMSLDKQSNKHVLLLEDALELWQAIMTHARSLTYELTTLISVLSEYFETGSEGIMTVYAILESYVLLDPQQMAESYSTPIFTAFNGAMRNASHQLLTTIVSTMETIIGHSSTEAYADALLRTQIICTIFQLILEDKLDAIKLVLLCDVLSRISLRDSSLFLQLVQGYVRETAAGQAPITHNATTVTSALMDAWFGLFDNMGDPRHRKLNAMALTTLLDSCNEAVVAKLPNYMSLWFDVVSEVNENGSGDALVYWTHPNGEDQADTTAEASRIRRLSQVDPVHTTQLLPFIKQHLHRLEQRSGGAKRFRENLLAKVDTALLEQMSMLA